LTYRPDVDLPAIHKLRRTVEGMPGGLTDAERQKLADNLNIIGIQILKLSQLQGRKRSAAESEAQRAGLLMNKVSPTTGIDALNWLGGYFSEGQLHVVELEQETPAHLVGSRSVNILLRESGMLVSLFNGL